MIKADIYIREHECSNTSIFYCSIQGNNLEELEDTFAKMDIPNSYQDMLNAMTSSNELTINSIGDDKFL